jgi:heme/copper-type cytochrome/quinol oxidase subunit 2
VVSGFLVYYYILIAMIAVVVIVIIIGLGVFMVRRRRRSAYQAQGLSPAVGQPSPNNIEYFQKFMPTFPA